MKYLTHIDPIAVRCGVNMYEVRFADPRRVTCGDADSPLTKKGTPRNRRWLRIAWGLLRRDAKSQRRLMNTSVHEAVHACGWHLAEETVEEIGDAVEDILWKLGYRRVVGPDLDPHEYED